jgi:hypothetical protein
MSCNPLRCGGSARAFRKFGGINEDAKAAAARLAVEVSNRRRVMRVAPKIFELCFFTVSWTENNDNYSVKKLILFWEMGKEN